MRISFPIRNLSAFRTVGPVIDAALANPRWEVELLLERSARHGNKAYEKPSLEAVPSRLRQRCRVQLLESVERLVGHLTGADVVVSHVGRAALLPSVDTSQLAGRTLWAAVFDAEHSTTPLHRFDDADAVFWVMFNWLLRLAAPCKVTVSLKVTVPEKVDVAFTCKTSLEIAPNTVLFPEENALFTERSSATPNEVKDPAPWNTLEPW